MRDLYFSDPFTTNVHVLEIVEHGGIDAMQIADAAPAELIPLLVQAAINIPFLRNWFDLARCAARAFSFVPAGLDFWTTFTYR